MIESQVTHDALCLAAIIRRKDCGETQKKIWPDSEQPYGSSYSMVSVGRYAAAALPL